MSNEESLIPSASKTFLKITGHVPLKELSGIPREWIETCIKSYGEEVRRITLEEAADKAKVEYGYTKNSFDVSIVDKDSILQLNQSDRLKIS